VEITLYTNLLGGGVHRTRPEGRNDYIWNFWERYIRFKPDLKFNYVMYYDINEGDSNIFRRMPGKSLKEIAGESAKMMEANFSRFIEPEKIRKMIDLAPEKKRSVMQLQRQVDLSPHFR
jgi:ABC-2 type transport system permease protein